MKITPVKNYKKPRYAALAMAAVTALAGCAETQTEGVAPNPNDWSEVVLDGDVVVEESSAAETEITTTVAPSGTVATFTEETTTETELEITSTNPPALPETIISTEINTTTAAITTTEDIPTEEIAEGDIVEISTEGVVVAPEDTLALNTTEEDVELGGDVAVEEDEAVAIDGDISIPEDEEIFTEEGDVAVEEDEAVAIDGDISIPEDEEIFTEEGDVAVAGDDTYDDVPAAEEFSLAGDIAVVPDYNAYNTGAEYAEDYINIFREYGIFLAEKPGDEWGPYTAIFENKPFILSLEGLRHSFYISFFDPEDKDFTDELRYNGMTKFEYGYYGGADINNTFSIILFIDISTDHFNNIGAIAEKMQSAGIPGGNAEQKSINIAYERIANNSFHVSDIVQAFEEKGYQLNAHTEGDYLIDYIGFELNKEIPLAFDSDTHKVYVMAYDSENPYDPIAGGLKENKAPETLYGAVLVDEYGYTYIFLDVSKIAEEGCYEIAAAAATEELEAK